MSTTTSAAGQLIDRDRWLCVELRHLAALDAIVREGSFRGAADSLGYVQSAISQQLSHLETLAGTRLLERARGSAPISVTDAGRLLLHHANVILSRFEAAQSELAALVEGEAGLLRVGAFQSVASRILPHVIPGFMRSSPGVRVQPTEAPTDLPLFDLLARGDIDLAFCQQPLVEGPFDSIDVIHDPYVLLVSTNSPLADREDAPPLERIAELPLIGFNDSRTQRGLLEALRPHDIEPEFTLQGDLDTTLQAFVAADLGVAIVPYLTVDPQHPDTTVLELPQLPARTIALVRHAERDQPASAEPFITAVQTTCRRRFRHNPKQ